MIYFEISSKLNRVLVDENGRLGGEVFRIDSGRKGEAIEMLDARELDELGSVMSVEGVGDEEKDVEPDTRPGEVVISPSGTW